MLAFLFYVQGNDGISARQQFGVLPWLRLPLCGWPGGRYAAIAGANSGDVVACLLNLCVQRRNYKSDGKSPKSCVLFGCLGNSKSLHLQEQHDVAARFL